MTRTASISGGLVKFADPLQFVNNLTAFRLDLRPNKYHWKDQRPALSKSVYWLREELWKIGGKDQCNYLLEYAPDQTVKLMLDVEWLSEQKITLGEAFAHLREKVLEPVNTFVAAQTGKRIFMDELVVEEACRSVKNKEGGNAFKQSFHVIWPDVCIKAASIGSLIDHLDLPDMVDRHPWRGNF